jgi:leader peptidase (prepilin peptidase)/N-methyltransferase
LQYYLITISLLFGLCLGSFLNVVVYRLPRCESLIRPGSHCPGCGAGIKWYDNVPVLSWLLLRGRCRACGSRISPRYIVVESVTGVAYALAMWHFGVSWMLVVAWAFIGALVAIAFIDYDHMIIPSWIVFPGAAIGLGASVALHPERWWVYLVAAAGGAAFFFMLVLLWPGGGMGMGDVYMALFLGVVLGASILVALFAAFLVGSIVGIYMMVFLKRSRKTKVPFGPFLAMGGVLAVFIGGAVLHAYSGLYS